MLSILNPNQNQAIQTFAKWVKIYAIVNIVFGVLLCISISGILVGIIQIIIGVDLLRSAKLAKELVENQNLQGYEALEKLSQVLKKLGTLAKYLAILNIAVVVIALLGVLLFFGTVMSLFSGSSLSLILL